MEESTPVSEARRDEALADIERYITRPDDLRHALKQFHALLEYSPENESVCTWEAAMDNCEQLKGYFPPTTPETVLENIDAIQDAIRGSRKPETSTAWGIWANPKLWLALAALFVLLWLLSHVVPRA
jgi:hypothetical protein